MSRVFLVRGATSHGECWIVEGWTSRKGAHRRCVELMETRQKLQQALINYDFLNARQPPRHSRPARDVLILGFQRSACEPRLNTNAQYHVLVVGVRRGTGLATKRGTR